MELTPFWESFLVAGGTMVLAWLFIGRPLVRQRRRPSQLGEILRRLSEEREAQRQSDAGLRPGDELPSADHDLADLDHRR